MSQIIQFAGDTVRSATPASDAWCIGNAEQLALIPEQVTQWRRDGFEVAGLLAYDAGLAWHGIKSRHPRTTPLAVLYPVHPDRVSLASSTDWAGMTSDVPFSLSAPFTCDVSNAAFVAAVARVKDYLFSGDCYQANLARRWRSSYDGDLLAGFSHLLKAHPAPWASFMPTPAGAVFGVSPECFLSIRGSTITTQPIKGSRPRGRDTADDQRLQAELAGSAKDRAENLMIVDLLRNDLGAIAETGSVKTGPLFELQSFSNVHHLVSTVAATLAAGVSPIEALMRCLPGGSITGAPKRRAMEIIDELEPCARGFYCGTQFWLGDWGLDSNILIRTFQAEHGSLSCHGGSGIVADSEPQEELRETAFKVERLQASLASTAPTGSATA